jgi:hypothetical protein
VPGIGPGHGPLNTRLRPLAPSAEAAGRSRGSAARWSTIRYAIDRWDRTLRLCLILLVASVPPSVIGVTVSWLLRRLPFIHHSAQSVDRTAGRPKPGRLSERSRRFSEPRATNPLLCVIFFRGLGGGPLIRCTAAARGWTVRFVASGTRNAGDLRMLRAVTGTCLV